MVALIISILLVSVLTLFWPSSQTDINNLPANESISEPNTVTEVVEEQEDVPVPKLKAASDDKKIALMKAEYEILDKSRKKLKQRLARLKHEMWGLKFPPEKAKQMSDIMLNAHKLIKNPDMLGAFSSVEGIQDETAKVSFADKALDLVSELIELNKQANNTAS